MFLDLFLSFFPRSTHQAMALDGDVAVNAPSPANAVSNLPALSEAGPSRKSSIAKRVGFFLFRFQSSLFSLPF